MNSTGINLVTKVGDGSMHEATLGLLQLNAMLLQPDKHYLEIVQVVRGTGDLDVVKVANYIGQTKEALIHGLLKNGRHISHTDQQSSVLV